MRHSPGIPVEVIVHPIIVQVLTAEPTTDQAAVVPDLKGGVMSLYHQGKSEDRIDKNEKAFLGKVQGKSPHQFGLI